MTALSIVQQVCAWQSLPIPTALFTATDAQTIEFRSLLNEEIGELARWPDSYWRKAIRQHTFTTVAAEIQVGAIPADMEYIIPSTMWDRTLTRPCFGPIDPQEWQAWEARPILTSICWGWRLRGNDFLVAPIPPAGDTAAYEYVSNLVVYASGDLTPTKQYFDADTDTSIFNELMVARGVRWRFLSQKKLSYDQEYATWIGLVQREVSRSKGMPVLNAARGGWSGLAGPYTPNFNFPG